MIFKDLPENAAFTVKDNNGTVLTPDDNNYFIQSYGVYNYDIICEGYKRLMGKYSVTSGSPEIQELTVSLELVESYGWDGKTFIEPSVVSVEESDDKNGFFSRSE